MAAQKTRVAIVGMGCTSFGEHWDQGRRRPARRRGGEAYPSAGAWRRTRSTPTGSARLSAALGPHALRAAQARLQAGHAAREHVRHGQRGDAQRRLRRASGAYDLVMAIGVEKLKDSGYLGLVVADAPTDGTGRTMTAPAMFSPLAPAYGKKYGVARTS